MKASHSIDDLDHLPINLKAYLRTDYLQGPGPTEWNSKSPIHPKQDFTLKWREENSILLRFRHQ